MPRKDGPMKIRVLCVLLLCLALVGCGEESEGATTQPGEVATAAPTTTTLDPARVETDRIIQSWIDGWMAKDVDGVVDLYADNGVYADVGCPFEMNGKSEIRSMVAGHLGSTTYTTVDPLTVTYTANGAVVEWLWGGTHSGNEFTMDASTTFEIEDGLITRSTDSYVRSDAPPEWEEACIDYNAAG